MNDRIPEYARILAGSYSPTPRARAVALADSRTGPFGPDGLSDIDLYVYKEDEIPLPDRERIASENSTKAEMANRFWEEGDEWLARKPAVKVDVMFRDSGTGTGSARSPTRLHDLLLIQCPNLQVAFRPRRLVGALKARVTQPYPDGLRDAILAKNHPVLRNTLSSCFRQIAAAAQRGDYVSLNHRVSALLASYFDILFAVNRMAHPGEKRLVRFFQERCPLKPGGFSKEVSSLLEGVSNGGKGVVDRVVVLLGSLDAWLSGLGLLPAWPTPKGRV